jgi:hypothetical protein
MTDSAFAFGDGRTLIKRAATAGHSRTGHGRTFSALRRRLVARRFAAAQREHDRRDQTDAYLDRDGMPAADRIENLRLYAQR